MRSAASLFLVCLLLSEALHAEAPTTNLFSVQDTVTRVLERLRVGVERTKIEKLDAVRAEALLTTAEKMFLATGHIRFRIDQPAVITVFRDKSLGKEPFWLREGDWRKTPATYKVGDAEFDLWERRFQAGTVGLGVNSLKGGGRHYFVAAAPTTNSKLAVDALFPAELAATSFVDGALPWLDRTDKLKAVPPQFAGQTLVQTLHARRDDARLVDKLRWTKYPASPWPDHVVLTWSGDPRTTQAVQWRTSRRVSLSRLAFTEASRASGSVSHWRQQHAVTAPLVSPTTVNEPVLNRHTVELTGLHPGTTYAYRIGVGEPLQWSEPRRFTTAPAGPARFSFIYMGDAQTDLDKWGRLIHQAYNARPDAAFYMIAGDLVNRGAERDDWDELFENARGVFDRRPLVPVIGNHDCQGGQPRLYLDQFALPRNGPASLLPERSYSFEYGDALFVILDSNMPAASQTEWLEETLARSRALWKFVAFHHPVYSSAPNRDNKTLRELWVPIFDRHRVHLVLQGHDHAYLRTYPLRSGRPTANPAAGTIYVVSVSGTKMYRQVKRAETAVGFTQTPTLQVIDVHLAPDRLIYRAYDGKGRLRDQFLLQRP